MSDISKHQQKIIQTFSRPSLAQTRFKSNQKIINCLKEEMCIIRESMSKMIRGKQAKGLKIVSGKGFKSGQQSVVNLQNNQNESQRNCQNMQNKIFKQAKEMEVLRQENQILKTRVRQLEGNLAYQVDSYNKKQQELELHNQALQKHIKALDKQLQDLSNQKSHNRTPSQQTKSTKHNILVEQSLNPELKKINIQAQLVASIDNLKKNNRHMSAQIPKLHEKIKQLQLLNNKHINLINTLTEKIIHRDLQKISAKYYQTS